MKYCLYLLVAYPVYRHVKSLGRETSSFVYLGPCGLLYIDHNKHLLGKGRNEWMNEMAFILWHSPYPTALPLSPPPPLFIGHSWAGARTFGLCMFLSPNMATPCLLISTQTVDRCAFSVYFLPCFSHFWLVGDSALQSGPQAGCWLVIPNARRLCCAIWWEQSSSMQSWLQSHWQWAHCEWVNSCNFKPLIPEVACHIATC